MIIGVLTPTQATYYNTVASALPVLLLAVIVQLTGLTRLGYGRMGTFRRVPLSPALSDAESSVPEGYGSAARRVFLLSFLLSYRLRHLWYGTVAALLVLAAAGALGLAAAGETAAFLALSNDASTSLERILTEAGLLATGFVLLVALARGVLWAPRETQDPDVSPEASNVEEDRP